VALCKLPLVEVKKKLCYSCKGADVNAEGDALGTPLQAAAWNGNVKILNLILEHGADLNAGGGLYGGALSAAIACKRDDVVEVLLSRGADVNQFYHERSVLASAWDIAWMEARAYSTETSATTFIAKPH
jgi:ankyrin repeat protein